MIYRRGYSLFFFFKQKTAYELRISDWSSDVCSSDLAYIAADTGLVVVDLSTPLEPRVTARLPLTDARASAVQFRYLWVTDAEGVKLFDITHMDRPVPVPSGTVRLADARKPYVARPYMRTHERRLGKESVCTCRSWWSPSH